MPVHSRVWYSSGLLSVSIPAHGTYSAFLRIRRGLVQSYGNTPNEAEIRGLLRAKRMLPMGTWLLLLAPPPVKMNFKSRQ